MNKTSDLNKYELNNYNNLKKEELIEEIQIWKSNVENIQKMNNIQYQRLLKLCNYLTSEIRLSVNEINKIMELKGEQL